MLLQNEQIMPELTFIQAYFGTLSLVIKKLERVGLPFIESMGLIINTTEYFKTILDDCSRKISTKVQAVLQRNPNLNTISNIADIFKGIAVEGPKELEACYWHKLKYATITSCDIERSFSTYKLILTYKRHQFTIDNLEKNCGNLLYSNYNK